jgi:hypothetical protein
MGRGEEQATDALGRALDAAIAGRAQALEDLLARGSGLPGKRANAPLAGAFAAACRSRGAAADGVALALARKSATAAPGGTALEFLPVCGVLAIGERAAADAKARGAMVAELHAHADDLRFRVRDAVVDALARAGEATGDALVAEVASWMDGYFHAAAVVRALAHDAWLPKLHDVNVVVARLDEAFALARDAPRAAARYPGHKALVEALETAPGLVAARFGVPVFDMLVRWSTVQEPALRRAIEQSVRVGNLAGRFAPEVARVRAALEESEPPPRNPDHYVGPTRGRGRKKSGRGRLG